MDVATAFLNADLDAAAYINVPDGMEPPSEEFSISKSLTQESLGNMKVAKSLRHSPYGCLNQFPWEWNEDLDGKLKELESRQSEADLSPYMTTFENGY